jgi:hypothetical protein
MHAARSARGPFEITQPAQTQILSRSPNSPPIAASPLLSPRRPSYRRAADPRWFDTAPPILAGLVLLRRSSLVRYCSAVRRFSMDVSQGGDGGQGGNGAAGRAGRRTTPIKSKKEEWTGRAEVQARPRVGRNYQKQVHRGKRLRARHTNHPK